MKKLKEMKDALICCAEGQIYGNLNEVNAQELGEVVDMIKDLEEAIYYCTVVEAMEEKEDYKDKRHQYIEYPYKNMMRYTERPWDMEDMFRPYDNTYPSEIRDVREGRSPITRRNYMESKELHHGKEKQMKELEKYMKELTEDIYEMIDDASMEEKAILSQKLSMLADKIK